MGISSARVLTVAFGLGVGAGGGLRRAGLHAVPVHRALRFGTYQLKSFVVTVLAGLGKPIGALAGRHSVGTAGRRGHALYRRQLDSR